MKKVSVIIPIYNVELYIERCLKSLLNQTYDNIELICVDDCGNDKSIELTEKLCEQYPEKIRIIYGEKNVGLGAARDIGMQYATGEYISFIDSDDYVETDFIKQYMDKAQKNNADVVVGGYYRSSDKKDQLFSPDINDPNYIWMNVSAWSKIYKKEFLEKHELDFRGIRRYEDEGFWYRIISCEPKIEVINYSGYHYWINNNSITKGKNQDRTKFFVDYLNNTEQIIKDVKSKIKNIELFEYCIMSGLTANLLYNARGCNPQKMWLLYKEYSHLLEQINPKIYKNKYISFKYLKSEPNLKRYATWLVMKFKMLRVDFILFIIDSII